MNLIDFLFPKQCLGCKRYGSYICEKCLPSSYIVKQKCIVCEKWAIDGFTHPRCEGKYTIDRTISIWDYNGTIRKAIVALKYKFAKEIADELTQYTLNTLNNMNIQFPKDSILVPIPMHWHRKNWRGFNQVEEIGKSLSQSLDLRYMPNLLLRMERRFAQVGLKAEERTKNIEGVFDINGKLQMPVNKPIVLFDDVYTTGATLKEAGKILKKAGAKKVWVLTIAR